MREWSGRARLCAMLTLLMLTLSACNGQDSNTVQGYVEGEALRLGAGIGGRIDAIEVVRGAEVAQGQRLFSIDAEPERAALDQAEAALAASEARQRDLASGQRDEELAVTRAQLQQAQAQAALSAAQRKRIEALYAREAVSGEQRDEAQAQAAHDEARVDELQAALRSAELAARSDAREAAAAEVRQAQAVVAQAQWNLDQKSVTAPAAGSVEEVYYRVGEWVAASAPVVAVLPPSHRILRFFVAEPKLGALRVGQPVVVHCDGCETPVTASIRYISASAEFTPPVIYSREQRERLAYRVEAAVPADQALRLHPGQPVDVELP